MTTFQLLQLFDMILSDNDFAVMILLILHATRPEARPNARRDTCAEPWHWIPRGS